MKAKKGNVLVRWNAKRAKWAAAAVGTFQKETGLSDVDGLDTAIGDMLGDLLHLCDREKLDFSELVERGRHYHEEETSSTCHKCKRTFELETDGSQDEKGIATCIECEEAS
jgi:hypothetical protein